MVEDQEAPTPGEGDVRFLYLIWTLSSAAWSQLGKIPHPVTNKIERDLDQAKVSIDYLRMLKEKTTGNLKPKEQELLNATLADLELNFADEAKKPADTGSKGPEIISPTGSASQGPDILHP